MQHTTNPLRFVARFVVTALALFTVLHPNAFVSAAPNQLLITAIKGIEEGQAISGLVTIQALASSPGVDNITFQIDGPATISHTEHQAPFYFLGDDQGIPHVWDTTQVANGYYTLIVTASDTKGRTESARLSFQIANSEAGRAATTSMPTEASAPELPTASPPNTQEINANRPTAATVTYLLLPIVTVALSQQKAIELKGIQEGQTVTGNVVIEAVVNSPAINNISFQLSGPMTKTHTERLAPFYLGGDDGGTPRGWDTTQVPDGNYALTVTAYLANASTTTTSIGFQVVNNTTISQAGPVYYVSRNGSNGDGRSWATAWNELKNIDWNVIQPGVTIVLDGGSNSMTYQTTLTVGKSGTASAPIRIVRASETGHNGQVVIDGGRATQLPYCAQPAGSWTTSTEGVRNNGIELNKSWVTIDGGRWRGIKIQRHDLTGMYLFAGAANLTIRNIEVTDNGFPKKLPDGSWMTDGAGIKATGSNVTIERAIVYDNGQDAIQSASGSLHLDQLTVYESWFYNNAHPVFGDKWARNSHQDGKSCAHTDGIQIYNGGRQSGLRVEDSVFGPRLMQALILGDSCSSCGKTSVSDVTVRNSLFHNSTTQSILMKNPGDNQWPDNWRIEQSTIYGGPYDNMVIKGGQGHIIRNSILVRGMLTIEGGLTLEGNCQWQTRGAVVGNVVDPLFANPSGGGNREQANFSLGAGSPCTGKGSTITSSQQLLNRPNR